MRRNASKPKMELVQKSIADKEAEVKDTLKDLESTHGEYHLELVDALEELSYIYIMNQKYDQALQLLHRRLVIHEKQSDDSLISQAVYDLGTTYRLEKKYNIAEQQLKRALDLRLPHYGESHKKVGESYNSLAVLYQYMNHPAADEMHEKALAIYCSQTEPEDEESEDIPFEVFKRLKLTRKDSAQSVEAFKGSLRAGLNSEHSRIQSGLNPNVLNRISCTAKHVRSRSDGLMDYHGDIFEEPTPVNDVVQEDSAKKAVAKALGSYEELRERVKDIRNVATSSGLRKVNTLLEKLSLDIQATTSDEDLRNTGTTMLELLQDLY